MKSFEEEIQPSADRDDAIRRLDTWIDSRTLSSEPYKYFFSYILDDKIISSCRLGVLNI